MKHLISATFKIKPASFIRLLVNYMFRLIMAAAKVVLIFVGLLFSGVDATRDKKPLKPDHKLT